MRGAKPKPTHLKIIAGNPGKRPLNKKEPKPEGSLTDPPDWMSNEQKKVWVKAIASAPTGLLKALDESVLVAWVVASDLHREASQKVARSGMVMRSPMKGEPIQNPYLPIINKQAQIMMKAAAEMGFTPSSRSRVSVDPGGGDDEWSDF
jgi:P27 family predicted phage terminase small subunit